ncbi:TlyA family RNA methyltransferase [Nordella sp. HKS 07]|uniref:TlyA family RNA methyltransferase n=1 Tax=Nordella sp. HKS 07 TaxID=2712222 RepID=UPI0013E159C7|nr:TlyA family RNA methyltransferase [Nordella sp. HKS 07]QIG49520.1 TlyA family RNA methyltransferase [Nordella sp. HKS 07]
MSRERLDEALVARGLYPTRSRARDAIKRGTVSIDGSIATKPAQPIAADAVITLADEARQYVARSALKLKHALDHFALSPQGLNCLDIGASTGGFTEVLLERGAAHVTAIDVGHDQFASSLRDDPRVTLWEGLNARDLAADHVKAPLHFIVCDVSFISLKLALPAALGLATAGARLVALIKPQFEAGREAVGKDGIVKDETLRQRICDNISSWLEDQGWVRIGLIPSPLQGGSGNTEYLIAAEKTG